MPAPNPDWHYPHIYQHLEKTGKNVRFHVKNIKHHYRITLPSILFEFDTVESVRSFGIDYILLADNIPRAVDGSLNVVVTTEHPERQA